MFSVAESLKFSAECFCGSFHEVCPAFVVTSFVVPSGRVNRPCASVRLICTYAGCSCMGTFSCGPLCQRSTRTCAFSNSTLQCCGSTFAGSCARATLLFVFRNLREWREFTLVSAVSQASAGKCQPGN